MIHIKFKSAFASAIKAIMVNRGRSFLTMLGVIIGVSSVVLLTSIGTGLQAYVTSEFEQLGSNNVIIYPGDLFGDDGGFDRESQLSAFSNNKLRLSDVRDIERLKEFVQYVVPLNSASDKATFRDKEETVSVVSTTAKYADVISTPMAKGRFFSKIENQSAERVIVLGWAIADELFGKIDPIGKNIKLGTQAFKVIGVAEEQGGTFGGPSFDTYVYIPLETGSRVYDTESIIEIVVKVKDTKNIDDAIKTIEDQLLERLDEDEFSVIDQREILDTINNILGVLTAGLGGIAAISLVVGGIGIMNIMLVSVTERTREIGLRKALGATPNQILTQFLIESALLSVFGGLIGLILAYLGSLGLQAFFPAKVTLGAVLLAFFVSAAVGIIFGATPARNASRLSPIEALRYE